MTPIYPYAHKIFRKKRKKGKGKKNVKRVKDISMRFRTFFSLLFQSDFSSTVVNIYSSPWANIESGGRRRAEESTRDGTNFLSCLFFVSSPLLSQLTSPLEQGLVLRYGQAPSGAGNCEVSFRSYVFSVNVTHIHKANVKTGGRRRAKTIDICLERMLEFCFDL